MQRARMARGGHARVFERSRPNPHARALLSHKTLRLERCNSYVDAGRTLANQRVRVTRR